MTDSDRNFKEQIFNITAQTGIELSENQKRIADIFLELEEHTTVKMLEQKSRGQGVEAGEDEIEELLQILCRFGAAQRHEFHINGEPLTVYEHLHLAEHHDHLACIKCGEITDFLEPGIEAAQSELCRSKQFTPLWHRTVLYGICGKCLGRRAPALPLSFASRGERVVVREIRGGDKIKRRLTDLGVTVGLEIEVMNNDGTMLIAARDSRVALGMGMAAKIMVSHISN